MLLKRVTSALQASGGTGKAYTINLILDRLRSQGKINSEDREFVDYLLACGDGLLLIVPGDGEFKVRIPEELAFRGDRDALIK